MPDAVFDLNKALRDRLSCLVLGDVAAQEHPCEFTITASPGADPDPAAPVHVVVTANEVTNLHGTGPLVKRACQGWPNVFSIRARNDWGVHDFGDWSVCLSPGGRTRAEFFNNALSVLRNRNVRTVLCVPYLADEFYTSIAIQECFGAKLCVYLMDDQNVASRNIPDALMREFLERSSLRLATHPELKAAYEQKYGLPFYLLPATVPASLVPADVIPPPAAPADTRRGALIGSFWDQSWYDRLCAVLSECDSSIDWFGNNKSPWLDLSPGSLAKAGITAHGIVPEDQLARELRNYPFVVVPVAALDETESNAGVARLSLPGRILFAGATSHTPVLVVGSRRTCGARFVAHFGLGEVVPYEASAVAAAMDRMRQPAAQVRMRQAAARIAPVLSDRRITDWLAQSIEQGAPADRRFEDLFSGYDGAIDLPYSPLPATVPTPETATVQPSIPSHAVEIRLRNQALEDKLLSLTGGRSFAHTMFSSPQGADAIVAHIEINNHHGVGVLLQRLFGKYEKVVSIRSRNFYGGQQDFGAMHACVSHGGSSREATMRNVLAALRGATVQRVLCVPYFPDDALTAIALKEAFGVPLCTFLMDDQNLCTDGISDPVMGELLAKSSLRLAISPEMCAAYEAKYGHKMWFMPPVAPTRFIPEKLNQLPERALRERRPVILGNIWGQHWLQSLRETVRGSGIALRWYNNGEFRWLSCSIEELARDGIVPQQGSHPDDTLVEILRQAPFVVLPSGTLDSADDRRFIAQLSFPSRIPYILATSHTPILVIGSSQTAAARAVTHLGIGMAVPYQRQAFSEAVERITRPDVNLAMRRAAFELSHRFADLGAAEWIWQSLAKGEAIDGRYEDLMPGPALASGSPEA
jgi:hypothetical protein